jgi:protein phosphatase
MISEPTTARGPTPARGPSPSPRPPLAVRSYGLSDRGRVRETNEDCFVIAELVRTLNVHHANLPHAPSTHGCHRGHVFLVADGVGGNRAGEIASGLGARTVEEFLLDTLRRFTNLKPDEEQVALRDLQAALHRADSRIFEEAAGHPEWRGMGTTLTLAFVVGRRLFVAHAGDSRCYLFSAGELRQLTQDHTITAEMVRRGLLTRDGQARHPWRHVVTNILGGDEPGVRVELHSLDLHPGDVILLCSDGLTEMVPEEAIAAVVREEADPRRACERLVEEANRRGGEDNVTVIVAHVGVAR